MTNNQIKARLDKISANLHRYAHRWTYDQEPSARMQGWVDEYNRLIEENPALFAEYCEERGFEIHNAYDALA